MLKSLAKAELAEFKKKLTTHLKSEGSTPFFPHITDAINAAKQWPNLSDKIIDSLVNNQKAYDVAFIRAVDLREAAIQWPKHAEKIIQPVLNNSEKFNQLVSSYLLPLLAKQWPNHADVFGKSTINEAKKSLGSRKIITKTFQILKEEIKNPSSRLNTLPQEIIFEIAAQTRIPDGHTQEEALKFLRGSLMKPALNTIEKADVIDKLKTKNGLGFFDSNSLNIVKAAMSISKAITPNTSQNTTANISLKPHAML